MDQEELASHFAAFCGPEKFLAFMFKLTTTCRYKERLLFWQQDLWDAFAAQHPESVPTAFDDIVALLSKCPIHQCSFLCERVRVAESAYWMEDYCQAMEEGFMFAHVFFWGSRPPMDETLTAEVNYCPECRREEAAWLETNDPWSNAVRVGKWMEPRRRK